MMLGSAVEPSPVGRQCVPRSDPAATGSNNELQDVQHQIDTRSQVTIQNSTDLEMGVIASANPPWIAICQQCGHEEKCGKAQSTNLSGATYSCNACILEPGQRDLPVDASD